MSKKYKSGSMKRKLRDKQDEETQKLRGSLDKFTFRTSLSTIAQSTGNKLLIIT